MSISSQNASYRRGVLLGLTMAEIIILVIFLLLLAFADMLQNEKEQNKALAEAAGGSNPRVASLIKSYSNQPADMSDDIVGVMEELPDLVSLVKKDNLSAENETVSQTIVRAVEALKPHSDEEIVPEEISNEDLSKLSLPEAIEKIKALNSDNKDLIYQKKNLLNTIEAKANGRGVDYPPCWPDKNGKVSDYLYSVDLTSTGIILSDMAPAHRIEDRSRLPLKRIKLNEHRSIPQFQYETEELLRYSNEKKCRFYVFVKDKTGATEKAIYKKELRAVEGSFYKLESNVIYAASTAPAKQKKPSKSSERGHPEDLNVKEERKTLFHEIFGSKPREKKELNE